jgi:formylglycine-generating enzyme required for sulfatase activity
MTMTARPVLALALAVALAAGCTAPPEGQLTLGIDTDAIVPRAANEPPDPLGQVPLFDRLRIEVYPDGSTEPCRECTREFGVDRRMFLERKVSFGLVAPPGSRAVVRLRLFRSTGSEVVEPRPRSTLDAWVRTPPIEAETVKSVSYTLLTETVGAPRGALDAPVDAAPEPIGASKVDGFATAQRRPCGALGPDETCVAGGAAFLGGIDANPERLVAVGPFALDRAEVTVGRFRASGLAVPKDPFGPSSDTMCTYAPGNDALPVVCLTHDRALAFCKAQGKTLPSEAQFEFAARNRGATLLPWGNDPATCDDAVFGRDPFAQQGSKQGACLAKGKGPAPPFSGTRDRTGPSGAEIGDLGGNVAEWVIDAWANVDEPCWSPFVLIDPVCTKPSTKDKPSDVARGGAWFDVALDVRERAHVDAGSPVDVVGFRCARSAP